MITWEDLNELVKSLACPECKGRGRIYDGEPGNLWIQSWTCPTCGGSGMRSTDSPISDQKEDHSS